MDRVVPFDQISAVTPGPFVNANPSAGQRGSIINADFFNAVQAELLAIQDEVGFTRDGTNLKQVMHAIRSGKLSAFADTGAPDALIVTPITAYAAIALGTEITVLKGNAANATTTPTLAVGAITHTITKEDGSALAIGDLPAHGLLTFKYDGSSAFRVVGLRKSDTTPAIPATALWHVGVDTSNNASIIVAAVTPAVANRLSDAAYLIIPANACAGATQINVGFGAPVALKRPDGTALQSGDYAAGQPLVIVDDGTVMRVVSLSVASSALVQSLISNFPSISPPKNGRLISAAGSYTLTIGGSGPNDPPASVTDVLLTGVGGGGGGAAAGTSSVPWSGGGGGSGGSVSDWIRGLTPGSTISLVIGAGGAGGTSGNGHQGGAGGSSTAVGGGKSLTATGGGGATGGTATCAGGPPGQGSGSSTGYNLYGAPGGDGNTTNATYQGGGGGASIFGGGGRTSTLGSNSGPAANGIAPGSGGGGIWLNTNGTEVAGNGAAGAWFAQW